MTKKTFIGLTGHRVAHYQPNDTNWGHDINKALSAIASSLDSFEYGIEDIARATTEAAGKRFQDLQDSLTVFVNEYMANIATEKEVALVHLKSYIDTRLNTVVQRFIDSSRRDLATTLAIKTMIENQVTAISESIDYLKSDFDTNLGLLTNKLELARATRDGTVSVLQAQLDRADGVLTNHINDKGNPHRTKVSQLHNSYTVYQLDPDNPTTLIEPPNLAEALRPIAPITNPITIIDDPSDFLGKVLGFGSYARDLPNTMIGSHYYLDFDDTTNDVVDSKGDAGTYIITGNILRVTWDMGSNKAGTYWDIGFPTVFSRLANLTIKIFSTTTGMPQSASIDRAFVLYFSDNPYPNALALMLGLADTSIYIQDGTDVDLNWSIAVDGAPASWGTVYNPGVPNPDYYIRALDLEPASIEKKAVEGAYLDSTPAWVASAHSLELSGFVDSNFLDNYPWWGFDGNAIYLRMGFTNDKITYIYNMFERVELDPPLSSSSEADDNFEDIPDLAYAVEVQLTLPDEDLLQAGDVVTVTTKRRIIQDGTDVAGSATAGNFTITTAYRYDG